MAINYANIPRPSKIYPDMNFWFAKNPVANPTTFEFTAITPALKARTFLR
jgi:hypothetical protein